MTHTKPDPGAAAASELKLELLARMSTGRSLFSRIGSEAFTLFQSMSKSLLSVSDQFKVPLLGQIKCKAM